MNTLRNAVLLSIAAAAMAAAQTQPVTPPAPPACLSGPVTVGTVTLSCTAVDNTAGGAGDNFYLQSGYIFKVKVASSDTAVVAVRVQLSVWQGTNPTVSRDQSFGISGGTASYTFVLGPGFDGNGQLIAPIVGPIQVSELKAASAQSF